MLEVGNTVKLHEDAVFTDGRIPDSKLFSLTLYVRTVKDNGIYTIGRAKTGAVLGDVKEEFLTDLSENAIVIDPYIVMLQKDVPLYAKADLGSSVLKTVGKFGMYTIIDEQNGMGKIKKGNGWFNLDDVVKI